MGYLPAALRTYPVRLGWSHGDDEIISTAQMIAWFGLDAIGRSPARFDFAKLEDLNGHYIRQAGDDELVGRIADLLTHVEDGGSHQARRNGGAGLDEAAGHMPGLKERVKALRELLDSAGYLFAARPLDLDPKAQQLLDAEARRTISALPPRLEQVPAWEGRRHRGGGARLCRGERRQARPRGTAPARRVGRGSRFHRRSLT